VWEDVHWSDPTTREALDLLIDRAPALRVLVILTFRPEFRAALDRSAARNANEPQPLAAKATRRDDPEHDPRQAAPQGDRRPDRRSHRRGAVIHRKRD